MIAMAPAERQMRNNDRRAERTRDAARHIADVDARLSKEVERSLAELKTYDAMPKVTVEGCVPEVKVLDQDTVAAVIEYGRGVANYCDLAVLDFASFTNPGGGYDRGTWAQEQALCAESTLFNVLREQKAWYGENRRRNINCELYRNRGLVVPKVRFDRGKFHGYGDVIVVAAPDARRARNDYHIAEDTLLSYMRMRPSRSSSPCRPSASTRTSPSSSTRLRASRRRTPRPMSSWPIVRRLRRRSSRRTTRTRTTGASTCSVTEEGPRASTIAATSIRVRRRAPS